MRRDSLSRTIAGGCLGLAFGVIAFGSDEGLRPKAEYPALAPDGTRLAYVSNVGGKRNLWISDANGANAEPLLTWPSDNTEPAWAPDGTRIVFSSNRDSSRHNIWIVDADGGNPIQLTSDDAEHQHPRFSPQGTSILYLSNSSGKNELWLMRSDGSQQRAVGLIGIRVSDPAWSPDGQAIVYVGCRRGGACNLFRINADGSGGRQITGGNFQDWNPDWGAPGILFASDRSSTQGLWMVQPDGSGLQPVTTPEGAADLDPRWGAGTMFVFSRSGQSAGDAAADIWSASSVGASPQRITRLVVDATPPVIVPSIAGTPGGGAWYVSDVTITWQIADPESGIASATGCDPVTLSNDTSGVPITCSATNGAGLTASVTVTIRVDRTPPVITGMPPAGCTLWAPNHEMRQIASAVASDALSGVSQFEVVGSSSQPQDPNDPDIVIAGDGIGPRTVSVRAARLGGDPAGRIYTIVATASDVAGNRSSATGICVVPHDQRP
jgi:hypothetical protein